MAIDTHGLPMKFEFYTISPERSYVVDFGDVICGNPALYTADNETEQTYYWQACDIRSNLERGIWKMMSPRVHVEDLL